MKNFIGLILITLLGCSYFSNQNSKVKNNDSKSQTSCKQSIMIDTLKEFLIPIKYNEFDTSNIRRIFKKPFSFKVIKTYPNEESFNCCFKSEFSEIFFSTEGYKHPFFLDYARITDNSIQFNYDINIGMSKEVFFKNLNQPILQCDSIEITEIGSTSLFIFNENKLKEIVLTTTI